MEIINQQFRLASRPVGLPKPSDWNLTKETIRPLKDGELLIKIQYISLDPAMRGWMNEGKTYISPVQIGDVMRALAVGTVVASNNANFSVGDNVSGLFGIQNYIISNGHEVTKIPNKIAPLPLFLSVLGMPGMTAYFGLLDIGRPKPGETVVVSAAAGAVGALVGQIAKLKGCRVVGIAGSKDKCGYITKELGFDAAIDYKKENVKNALQTHCPDGIDIYFDNVGGEILDAALSLINMHARVIICGAISQYNNTTTIKGPSNYLALLMKRATMQGFIVFDYFSRYPEGIAEMAKWVSEGKIKSQEDIVDGLETFPDTFLKLFRGENAGKLILKVGAEN